jgi:hypothetical protein
MGRAPRSWSVRIAAALLAVASAAVATAQEAPPVAASDPVSRPETEDPSLERIRKELARQPTFVLQTGRVFRLDVTERRPRYFDLPPLLATPKQPTLATPRWHDEFLSMVTPPEFRTWQAFTGKDLVMVAGTNLAMVGAASVVGAAINEIVRARRNAHEGEARREVDQALDAFLAVQLQRVHSPTTPAEATPLEPVPVEATPAQTAPR